MLRIRSKLALWLTTSLVIILLPHLVWGQRTESADWAADIANRYRIVPNITYLTANNYEAKLDLYLPRTLTEPSPTLVYIHGGGWVQGSQEVSTLRLLPYLEMGWSVINVDGNVPNAAVAFVSDAWVIAGDGMGSAAFSTSWYAPGSRMQLRSRRSGQLVVDDLDAVVAALRWGAGVDASAPDAAQHGAIFDANGHARHRSGEPDRRASAQPAR